MKTYEERSITRKEKFLIQRKCDLCGRPDKEKVFKSLWGEALWDINETEIKITIRQKEGHNYPEGGSGTEYEIDLCPECFKNRLVPWLKSQGANIEEKEWDW